MFRFKKVLSLIVLSALVLTLLPNQAAFASAGHVNDSRQKDIALISTRGGYEAPPFDTSNLNKSGKSLKSRFHPNLREEEYPPSFRLFQGEPDSVDEITPVLKDQTGWGVCWTFSALGSAESSLYKDGDNDYDFSERHLAYFTYHGKKNKNLQEDGTDGDTYLSSTPFDGGNAFKAIATLSRGTGVAWESDVPYPTRSDFKDGHADGFEKVDEAHHFDSHFQLKECNFLPNQDADGNLDGSAIKAALQRGTSVAVSYCSETGNYNKKTDGLPYPTYYCGSKKDSNHAVQIVGWDDTIPASAFSDNGAHLSNPGAWIIKNSWGEDNADIGGAYFYISYEDKTLSEFCTFIMDSNKDAPRYSHNYQYDGDGNTSQIGTNINKEAKAANVFTATGDQKLDAVAFYTTDPDAEYKIQVYTDVKDSNPEYGTKAFSKEQTGTETYAGYHTIALDEPVALKSGQKFSVVLSVYNPNHRTYPMAFENNVNNNGEPYSRCGIQKGQSYLYTGSSWEDMVDFKRGYGNICLKAFTNDSGEEPSGEITLTPSSAKVERGQSQIFTASVTGLEDSSVNWSISGNASKDTVIDRSGKLTVALDESAKELTVRAESSADSRVFTTAQVTVLPPKDKPYITLTPSSVSVAKGTSQAFTASVTGMDDDHVKWSVSDHTSDKTTIDSTGNLTVALDESASKLTVRAECVADSHVFTTAQVTVLPPKTKASITLTPSSARVVKGTSQTFTAHVTGLKDSSVNWSISGNASSDTVIDRSGRLTVALEESATKLTVKAECAADSSVFKIAQVTLLSPSKNQKRISKFDSLDTDIKYQMVKRGESVDALDLPKLLKATLDGTGHVYVNVANWGSDPSYDSSAIGTYVFKPVLSDEYVVLSDAILPTITVTVTNHIPNTPSKPHSKGGSGGGRSSGGGSPSVDNNNPANSPGQQNTDGPIQIVAGAAVNTKPTVANRVAEINAFSEFDIAFAVQHATAQRHSEVDITLPSAEIISQLNRNDTDSVNLTVKMISSPVYTVSNVDFVMNLDPQVLQLAKQTGKGITVSLVDHQTGKENYSWTFNGADLATAGAAQESINLALSITSTASDFVVNSVVPASESGTLLTFANHGVLPVPARIKAYVGNQGFVSGQTLYLYCFNPALNRLETVDSPVCKVDSTGYANLVLTNCSQYVLLPQQVSAMASLKLDTGKTLSVKAGSTYVFKVTAPARPTFVSGNSSVFKVISAGSKGNNYFYKVIAVGKVKSSTGFYMNHEKTPRTVATIV